jgi:putative nucleotidyltransferase with HDIG domain
VGKQSSRQQIVHLPLVLCATFFVTVCPVLLVWWLRDSGIVTSVWVGIGISVAVSFGASYLGSALWKTRTASRDVLFGELMLWGWVQRWRADRRLATATDVLGLRDGPRQSVSDGGLSHEQRAGLLTQLASALEAQDPYTHGHSRRVARHASNIAKRMGLPAAEIAKIRTAGVLHDVGKVKISQSVLHKEGALTDGEYKIVKRHPVEGATMVSTLGDDELTAMVRHHHEQFDGTGYPEQLAAGAIPLGSRILAVADTFDAITSTRPYRPAHAHKEAIEILTGEAGKQLDPDAVRAFRSCYAGRRSLALWIALTNGPPRLASWLGGGLSSAKASSVANVMAAAATTAAVGGAALAPLVEAPTRSNRAAEAVAAPDVAPAVRQRGLPPGAAGDGGGHPVNARAPGRGHGLGGTIAPGALHGQRRGNGENGTTTPGGAPAPGRGHSGSGATTPGAPGNGNGNGGNSAPGHSNGNGNGPTKRPAPNGGTSPGNAKPAPAGGGGPAGNPGGTSPGGTSPGGTSPGKTDGSKEPKKPLDYVAPLSAPDLGSAPPPRLPPRG